MAEGKAKRPAVDWESVEREYRTGVRSLRDIAAEFGCSEGAIRKKAKGEDWTRDLSAKINARADALVRKSEVRNAVRTASAISDKEQIQASAAMIADKVINQRADIQRARAIVQKLWDAVDAELNHPVEFARLGDMLRSPDEFGQDKLNDMYFAAIGLPQQVKNVKLLADSLKVLIELERKVLRLDDQKPVEVNPLAELVRAVSGTALPVAQQVSDDDDE